MKKKMIRACTQQTDEVSTAENRSFYERLHQKHYFYQNYVLCYVVLLRFIKKNIRCGRHSYGWDEKTYTKNKG